MSRTKIEWATDSWNPVTGCTPVSEGCENCYAKRRARMLRGRSGYPQDDPFRVTFHENRLQIPLRWRKPRRAFVCSMGDLFHPDVKMEWFNLIWSVMYESRRHVFMLLTKRPEQIMIVQHHWNMVWPSNIWLGVTAENQARADERIPLLLQIPAAVRFVSVEPMLGPVDLNGTGMGQAIGPCGHCGETKSNPGCEACMGIPSLDWVICGAETGPGARPMNPEWAWDLRDQCAEAGVPFFFKKWSGGRRMEPGEMPREIP